MVHRQTNTMTQLVVLVSLLLRQDTAVTGESHEVSHINVDSMTVTQGNRRGQFKRGRQAVTERNDTVQADFMEVRTFQLEDMSVAIQQPTKQMDLRRA